MSLKFLASVMSLAVPLLAIMLLYSAQVVSDTKTNLPPLETEIRNPADALTFARIEREGRVSVLLVISADEVAARAVDLGSYFDVSESDPFEFVRRYGHERLATIAREPQAVAGVHRIESLMPTGPEGGAHVAAGVNYIEHGEETGLDDVFLFPKLSQPQSSNINVQARAGMLLDYEVEICARFDRAINTVQDYDGALKGFFLCGDLTDRAVLLRTMNPMDIESGIGFTDAKSGPDRFPTGPFLIVPRDWKSFIADETIATHLNGQGRQSAKGAEMIKDLRMIVSDILLEGRQARWRFEEKPLALIGANGLTQDMAVLTGTPEGTIFKGPGALDIASGILAWIAGGFLEDGNAISYVSARYATRQEKAQIYLKPGDQILHSSSSMGRISIRVEGDL